MPKIITYSLLADEATSDCYYTAIADLADQWVPSTSRAFTDILSDYRTYQRLAGLPERADMEYLFELLVLGVMLREHGGAAERFPLLIARLMRQLIALAGRYPRLEQRVKRLRGWLAWLGRQLSRGDRRCGRDVARLLEWMRAHGLASRADRLETWRQYLAQQSSSAQQIFLARLHTLADEFERLTQKVLGKYTDRVYAFIATAAPQYARRYDMDMLTRTPLEYHLGMLGTELLNRVNRERFAATKQRVVIVPPCMRAQPDDVCRATATPLGAKCQHCTTTCQVHVLTQMGRQDGFEVRMIPDQMARISSEASQSSGGLGLVGVSCALTNWSGGWDTDALGIPAQGVLLDYVGCIYHWDEQGIPTAVNAEQLRRIAAQ